MPGKSIITEKTYSDLAENNDELKNGNTIKFLKRHLIPNFHFLIKFR